jgi:hypothetical protein
MLSAVKGMDLLFAIANSHRVLESECIVSRAATSTLFQYFLLRAAVHHENLVSLVFNMPSAYFEDSDIAHGSSPVQLISRDRNCYY